MGLGRGGGGSFYYVCLVLFHNKITGLTLSPSSHLELVTDLALERVLQWQKLES